MVASLKGSFALDSSSPASSFTSEIIATPTNAAQAKANDRSRRKAPAARKRNAVWQVIEALLHGSARSGPSIGRSRARCKPSRRRVRRRAPTVTRRSETETETGTETGAETVSESESESEAEV